LATDCPRCPIRAHQLTGTINQINSMADVLAETGQDRSSLIRQPVCQLIRECFLNALPPGNAEREQRR